MRTRDHGRTNIMAAELKDGAVVYPPHSIRQLARAYLDLLQRIADYNNARAALMELPVPLKLPEYMKEDLAKLKRCQHGQAQIPDGRDACLACRWMEQGKVDAAYHLCKHDANSLTCEECNP